jgi:hypothetical protein
MPACACLVPGGRQEAVRRLELFRILTYLDPICIGYRILAHVLMTTVTADWQTGRRIYLPQTYLLISYIYIQTQEEKEAGRQAGRKGYSDREGRQAGKATLTERGQGDQKSIYSPPGPQGNRKQADRAGRQAGRHRQVDRQVDSSRSGHVGSRIALGVSRSEKGLAYRIPASGTPPRLSWSRAIRPAATKLTLPGQVKEALGRYQKLITTPTNTLELTKPLHSTTGPPSISAARACERVETSILANPIHHSYESAITSPQSSPPAHQPTGLLALVT